MKRKGLVNKDAETLYKETDFFRRFQQTIQRGLKDHRYVMEFELTGNKRYADDADQKRYLIAKEGDEEFLVFVFSIVKVAFAMDEAAFYKQIRVNLELRENKLDSFSRIKNYPATIALNVGMLIVFFGIMYALFPSLRTSVFALFKPN